MPGGACVQVALAKATDWDTPALFATAKLWPILSEDISNQIELLENQELGGCVEMGASDSGVQSVTGTVTRYLHYEGDELALAVGLGATAFTSPGPPTVLDITRQGDLTGLGITLWFDLGVSIWKVDVAKVENIAISGSQSDGYVQVVYTIMGDAMPFNEAEDFSTLTEPALEVNNFVLFRHLQYGINAVSAGSIDPVTTDKQLIEAFDISIANGLEFDFRNQVISEEPDRTAFGTVTGSITIGKYEDNDRVSEYQNQTKVKQLWQFLGATGGANGDYIMRIQSPAGVLTAPSTPVVPGPGRVPMDYTWQGERAVSVPSGMLAVDTAIQIDGVSADPLA